MISTVALPDCLSFFSWKNHHYDLHLHNDHQYIIVVNMLVFDEKYLYHGVINFQGTYTCLNNQLGI